MADFLKALPVVLAHEGGFVNDPVDPGGATKYGISLYWLKHQGELDHDLMLKADVNHDGRIDVVDIAALTPEIAADFYRDKWWNYYRYDRFPFDAVATKVLDTAVNIGGIPAHRLLQSSLCSCGITCTVDGLLGAATVAALYTAEPKSLVACYRLQQAGYYKRLVTNKVKFTKYINGWLRRAAS